MKVTLDLETNEIIVPKNFFEKISKENEIIEKHGGNPISPVNRVKNAFETAMSDTDKYLHTKD